MSNNCSLHSSARSIRIPSAAFDIPALVAAVHWSKAQTTPPASLDSPQHRIAYWWFCDIQVGTKYVTLNLYQPKRSSFTFRDLRAFIKYLGAYANQAMTLVTHVKDDLNSSRSDPFEEIRISFDPASPDNLPRIGEQ